MYDKANNIIYVHFIAADTDRFIKEYFKNEILGAFHLSDLKLEILPVYYPAYYLKKHVEDIDGFHINNYQEQVFITFLATHEGRIFDYSTKEVQKIALPKSMLDQKEPEWFKWKKHASLKDRLNQIITNRIYDNMLELSNHRGFVRFYRNSVPLKDEDGTFNSKMDKRHTLMLIDTSYNLIEEYYLPKYEFYDTYYAFVKGNKLYINNFLKDAKDKAHVHFDIFDLDFMQ